jgi:hypothetical protein
MRVQQKEKASCEILRKPPCSQTSCFELLLAATTRNTTIARRLVAPSESVGKLGGFVASVASLKQKRPLKN